MLEISIKEGRVPGTQVITLSGEFDFYEKGKVIGLLPKILSDNSNGLIIDLAGVTLLASAGVEALILYQEKLTRAGKKLAIVVDHNNYLIRKFTNLGLFEGAELDFYGTVEEAESAFAKE